jgi:hypothetical protein
MDVVCSGLGKVVVDNQIDALDNHNTAITKLWWHKRKKGETSLEVHATSEEVGGDENPYFSKAELLDDGVTLMKTHHETLAKWMQRYQRKM